MSALKCFVLHLTVSIINQSTKMLYDIKLYDGANEEIKLMMKQLK